MLSAKLKKEGFQVEFLPELARKVIRNNKVIGKGLEHSDQEAIKMLQENEENVSKSWNGDGCITISDGSTINSLYYLGHASPENIAQEAKRYDLIFACGMIKVRKAHDDDNRIHDKNFSEIMNEEFIFSQALAACPNVIHMVGSPDDRLSLSFRKIMDILRNL